MSRINILLADNDEFYIDGLSKYLVETFSDRLNVIAFTEKSLLLDYVRGNYDRIDMLLIGPDMLCEELTKNNTICLSESKNSNSDVLAIFKYQSADNIASQIFDEFSKLSDRAVDIKSGSHKCTVAAIFSPVGGIGKSTVSAALCKYLSQKGYAAFYLNLETAPSTLDFLKTNSVSNFSNVLYGIKENNKNLTLKIEAAISTDSSSGVAFFAPGESPFEMEEMLPEEMILLISQLKASGRFDYIAIDMTSAMNAANIEILKASDVIITISGKGSIIQSKINSFNQIIEIIRKRENIDLSEKNILIVNKNRTDDIGMLPEGISKAVLSLPELELADGDNMTNSLSGFMDSLVSRLNLQEKVYEQG